MPTNIRFHVGGPSFHPVEEQARAVLDWLGPAYTGELREDAAAFDDLGNVDLLVIMGLFWTGSPEANYGGKRPYQTPSPEHRQAYVEYVRSGRPLLAHHGGIASYDDWPQFAQFLGFRWNWGKTSHSPQADWTVRVLNTGHPVVQGVQDFTLRDELYHDVEQTADVDYAVHAVADYEGRALPMVVTVEGGRVGGAGKTMWLANGHDMKAFESPALQRLWINSVRWLTQSK